MASEQSGDLFVGSDEDAGFEEASSREQLLVTLQHELLRDQLLQQKRLQQLRQQVRNPNHHPLRGLFSIPTDKAKAYFRRGQARVALKDLEDAVKDFEEAAKLAPEDAGIKNELAKTKGILKESDKKEKAAFKKFDFSLEE